MKSLTSKLGLAVVALALGCSGCAAQRRLTIVSEPPGATVRLDDRIVGSTPYQENFQAYGVRRVTLYRTGYRTISKQITLKPPWYARFPIDIVTEVLVPVGWKDEKKVKIVLEPESGEVTTPDLDAVLERAKTFRLAEPEGPRPAKPNHDSPQ